MCGAVFALTKEKQDSNWDKSNSTSVFKLKMEDDFIV